MPSPNWTPPLIKKGTSAPIFTPIDSRSFFDNPKGMPVVIMAITHAEFQENLVVREYITIDEVSIWMQIFNQN